MAHRQNSVSVSDLGGCVGEDVVDVLGSVVEPRDLQIERAIVRTHAEMQGQLILIALTHAGFDLAGQGPAIQVDADLSADGLAADVDTIAVKLDLQVEVGIAVAVLEQADVEALAAVPRLAVVVPDDVGGFGAVTPGGADELAEVNVGAGAAHPVVQGRVMGTPGPELILGAIAHVESPVASG